MSGRFTEREERTWIEGVVRIASQVSDAAVLELHREVSRLATRARQRDPKYVTNQRLGYSLSRDRGAA